jgi:hypothetical protein
MASGRDPSTKATELFAVNKGALHMCKAGLRNSEEKLLE